jgi:hypothetical protein
MSTIPQESCRYHLNWYEIMLALENDRKGVNYSFSMLQVYDFTAEDLEDMGEIGRGNFGSVNKMLHIRTNTVMAVKVQIQIDCNLQL